MVSLRRHFVPNPVTIHGTDSPSAPPPYSFVHTRYDRAGNRTSRTNVLDDDLSETYTYNAVDELISSVRENGFDQSWTLDSLGNWLSFDDDGDQETRTSNAVNEITAISGGSVTPAYWPASRKLIHVL